MTTGARLARFALALAVLGALAMALSPAGYRAGLWGLRVSFYYLLGAAIVLALLAVIAALIGMVLLRRSGMPGRLPAFAALVLGLVVAGYPVAQIVKARSVPAIHDITTDTADPPAFVALAEARRVAPNGLEYGGGTVAELQKQAYPDLATFRSELPSSELLALATKVAVNLGWSVAEASSHEGRIEATDTTRLFGFKDDVVIRIRSAGRGSALDIRSASRLGTSDLGANAGRIRTFLDRLRASGG